LYRSGQQAEALAAYRAARRRLVDEIGIEPGPGLREMNQMILRADPALLRPAPRVPEADAGEGDGRAGRSNGGPAPGAVRPSLLPSAAPEFTGRAAELAVLSAMPGPPDRPVVITAIGGTAGVGKTALAVHWARQAALRFPDGQLYVNLRGFGPADPLLPAEALRTLLDALGVPAAQIPASPDARHALYRSLLDGKKTLVLLDNARDPAQVRPLLPGTADAQVLITSRAELASLVVTDGARQISLDVLAEAEARQMLAARLGAGRVADEPQAADELIGLCARLPLALAITAARAAAHPGFTLAALAGELADAARRLDELSTGDDATDVRAVFSWSYRSLPAAAARMFRLLGLHPGPDITAEAAASLAGLAGPEARRLLRELARGHLLSEPAPGRYAFHDLLRAYAAERAAVEEAAADRHAARHRILDHYLHTVYAAGLLVVPGRVPISLTAPQRGVTPEVLASDQQAKDWFDAEHHVLIAAATLAAEAGFDVHAWQLPSAMADLLNICRHWHEEVAVHRGGLEAATRLGGQPEQAEALLRLADHGLRLGDYDQGRARIAASLELFRQAGDRKGQARAQLCLSALFSGQGHDAEAVRCAEKALALFQAIGDRDGQAATLNNIGWFYAILGRAREARTFCEQSIALQRELGNRNGEAHAWDSLGYAEYRLGHLAEAAAFYQRALDLYRELGARFSEAESLSHLGDVHQAAGDHTAAREAWQQALPVLDDMRHPEAAAVRDKLRHLAGPGGPPVTRSAAPPPGSGGHTAVRTGA
jgi:tetratricopeptide (TPR) repeat protein